MSCPVCEGNERSFGRALVLRKHDADYLRCRSCGLVRVADPHWLEEAYAEPIASRDIGLVGRNLQLAATTQRILRTAFPHARRFLDFGGGNGLFVRLMRDAGYDFSYFDAYGPNLFAKGFATDLPMQGPADVVTAFEVLEHLLDPVRALSPALAGSGGLIASTTLLPAPPPAPGSWWYYTPETGQHVTFFTARALAVLAERFGWHVSSSGSIHVFSSRPVDRRVLRILASERLWKLLPGFGQRPSLLAADYAAITDSPPS